MRKPLYLLALHLLTFFDLSTGFRAGQEPAQRVIIHRSPCNAPSWNYDASLFPLLGMSINRETPITTPLPNLFIDPNPAFRYGGTEANMTYLVGSNSVSPLVWMGLYGTKMALDAMQTETLECIKYGIAEFNQKLAQGIMQAEQLANQTNPSYPMKTSISISKELTDRLQRKRSKKSI